VNYLLEVINLIQSFTFFHSNNEESGGHAVKLEGGKEIKESIKKILNAGIPVMGHLGLTHNLFTNLEPIPFVQRRGRG
jgi:hypothetical protein